MNKSLEERFEEYHNEVEDGDNDNCCLLTDSQILKFLSQEQVSLLKKFEEIIGEDEKQEKHSMEDSSAIDREIAKEDRNELRQEMREALTKIKKEYETKKNKI